MNNCPHLDYGKSADKALGAYCTAKKKLVEPEDCEECKEGVDLRFIMGGYKGSNHLEGVDQMAKPTGNGRPQIESFPCCICGEDIPISNTQILVVLGEGKYKSCCCSHEGSKELSEYIKDKRVERRTEI